MEHIGGAVVGGLGGGARQRHHVVRRRVKLHREFGHSRLVCQDVAHEPAQVMVVFRGWFQDLGVLGLSAQARAWLRPGLEPDQWLGRPLLLAAAEEKRQGLKGPAAARAQRSCSSKGLKILQQQGYIGWCTLVQD